MKIVVSAGDINGVGLECFFKALTILNDINEINNSIEFVLVCSPNALLSYCKQLNISLKFVDGLIQYKNFKIILVECKSNPFIEFGKVSIDSGEHSIESIDKALEYLKNGNADAFLTLPISKEAVYLSGFKFPGHTEYIANYFGVFKPLMILFSDNLRVALATVHLPIKSIPEQIKQENILNTLNTFNNSLRNDFAIQKPKIAVLSLNPHAGENGSIGEEEINEIIPAIEKLKKESICIDGPFPSDGIFAHNDFLNYDGIFAMYHDQGLTILKYIAKGGGVNFTAGLPIIRTSPDHGTAFNIAGKNKANAQSTLDAILWAENIYNNRNK